MSLVDALRTGLAQHAAALHAIARDAIRHGLASGAPLRVALDEHPAPLRQAHASFVTLRRDGALRGCVGAIEALHPLAEDVAHNAFQSAFRDPRVPSVRKSEFAALSIEISVLTPLEPLPFADEADLLARLAPGRDGLCLELDDRRGVFLPQVWDMLPDPRVFLAYLKDKAGLPPSPLDPAVRAFRFEAIKLSAATETRARRETLPL